MKKNQPAESEMLVYRTDDGKIKLDVRLENETIWLTQQMMADLFQSTKQNIGQHLKNIFNEGELVLNSVVKKNFTTAVDGKQYSTNFYNLDAIISVGYRVKSIIATHFRIWATELLKEYIIKGFVLDDERLKNPTVSGSSTPDYFDEMLARIRDIRSSERRMYLRIREIFSLAADYEPTWKETTKFFSVIQNKLHYAATGMTATELIRSRADAGIQNMGLTNWQKDEIRKTDVTIAKNYLHEAEINELNRIVVMWLDFAEDQVLRRKQIFLQNWKTKLDEFLTFNERELLHHAGKISREDANAHAKQEYDLFAIKQREHKEELAEAESIRMLEETAKRMEDGALNRDNRE